MLLNALVVHHLPVEALMLAPTMIRNEVSVAVAAVLCLGLRLCRLCLRLPLGRLLVGEEGVLALLMALPYLQCNL